MSNLVECVPNFSEGRNPDIIERIVQRIKGVHNIYFLGKHMDPDHHRTVVTFAGSPKAVLEAAFQGIVKATETIDLNKHRGEHPRMGATDICPFIPLGETPIEKCIELANLLGERVARELEIPVYLYENAARRPGRKNLASIRRGGFEKIRQIIATDPDKKPDFGPARIHPTAGAIGIAARFFLIAYNVNLATEDVEVARQIADKIREKNGGYPNVKALGFALAQRKMVQVSMNLTDYRKTSMKTMFDVIEHEARKNDVPLVESELVGLVPMAAVEETMVESLRLAHFDAGQIIENQIRLQQLDSSYGVHSFLQELASTKPAPGGGSVAALVGALAAALAHMVANITRSKKKYQHLSAALNALCEKFADCQQRLTALIQEDTQAYRDFIQARKLPKETPEQKKRRKVEIDAALAKCVLVPLDVTKTAVAIIELLPEVAEKGMAVLISDVGIACHLAATTVQCSIMNIEINAKMLKDVVLLEELQREVAEAREKSEQLKERILQHVGEILAK